MTYTVRVDDNYHCMDESQRYTHGEFETYDEALTACRGIVDQFTDRPGDHLLQAARCLLGLGEKESFRRSCTFQQRFADSGLRHQHPQKTNGCPKAAVLYRWL